MLWKHLLGFLAAASALSLRLKSRMRLEQVCVLCSWQRGSPLGSRTPLSDLFLSRCSIFMAIRPSFPAHLVPGNIPEMVDCAIQPLALRERGHLTPGLLSYAVWHRRI